MREQIAYFDAAVSVLPEGERRSHKLLRFALLLASRHDFPVVFRQRRLGVEGVDMRRTTVQKQKDDVLGFGREVRRARLHRSGGFGFFGQQGGKSEHAETISGVAQKL